MLNKTKKQRIFVADFETTVYDGQLSTEVWAASCVEIGTENVKIFHSIGEQFEYFSALDCSLIVYYHNLKFDGNFWLYYFLHDLKYEQAFDTVDAGEDGFFAKAIPEKDMKNRTFKYVISDMGQWYSIVVKIGNHIIEFRDSLKLLPFSVAKLGKDFQTKHQKLEMEYTGYRYAGCEITEAEKSYIANDVLVVKEALEIMFAEGHTEMTIGACCLTEFKRLLGGKEEYNARFPNMYECDLPSHEYGNAGNVGRYLRKAYRGGWCYVVPEKTNQIKHNGTTADVNSLYPSMMHSESGNRYPIGKPTFWTGDFPRCVKNCPEDYYYFVRIKCRFHIKPNKLPFIQIKGNILYRSTESLTTSDYRAKDGTYHRYYTFNGEVHDTAVTLTLTQTDFKLICDHYYLDDFEILDGCYFLSEKGIFDEYIDKYRKIKMESKGAKRQLAKLFLNNLYGKMGASPCSSFKYVTLSEDDVLEFQEIEEYEKTPGYLPIGCAITSYARNFTIRAAQQNYYGIDKPGFIYADTDSIHCDLQPEQIKGIRVDDKAFCCWKLESSWDYALFVRQKTYTEHITHNDLKPVETPYLDIKCAGMPERCKNLFIKSLEQHDVDWYIANEPDWYNNLSESEKIFVTTPRELTDFKIGLNVPGKLLPKRIKGGVLLVDTSYEMR